MRRLKISGSSSMAMEMREGAMILELLFEEATEEGEVEGETAGEEGWL